MLKCVQQETIFQKVKFYYKAMRPGVSYVAGFSTAFFIRVLFLRYHQIYYYYCVAKCLHEQFLIMYFNILAFVNSLSNFNIFLFEQSSAVSISHNIGRNARIEKKSNTSVPFVGPLIS